MLAFAEKLLIASVTVASIPALATGSQIVPQSMWPRPGEKSKTIARLCRWMPDLERLHCWAVKTSHVGDSLLELEETEDIPKGW